MGAHLRLLAGGAPAPKSIEWIRANSRAVGWSGAQSCTSVCAAQSPALVCVDDALRAAQSQADLLPQLERHFLCVPPLLSGCLGAPRMSGLGDGHCWYRDDAATCGAETTLPCDEVPPDDYESNIRLCACRQAAPDRRALHDHGWLYFRQAKRYR